MDLKLNQLGFTLKAISERQKLVTNNVANAHTPGYMAKDISFSDLLQMDNPFETRLSQEMGKRTPEANSTGLPVDLQKEMIEMQKNMLFYGMASRRVSTVFNTLKTASQIGR